MYRIFGHRYCCHIPEWTVHVGHSWQPVGEGRWNLFNAIWRIKNAIRMSMT